MAIQGGRVQKYKPQCKAKGKGKGKGPQNSYPTKPKKPQPYKKEPELMKKKKKTGGQNVASTSLGSIMYAVRCTRPDVAFAHNITSQFQQNSGEAHWTAVKNILKYLRNTKDRFLVYGGDPEAELRVNYYCDAGFETDRVDTKSQTGYVFILSGGAVVWKSSKQSTTAQHAIEAEYMAESEAAKEVVWIRKFIDELGVVLSNDYPIKINCDNSAAIIMVKESGIQKGARHFKRKYHFVRECIETKKINIVKVHTYDNLANSFTKALAGPKPTRHARIIGTDLAKTTKKQSKPDKIEHEIEKNAQKPGPRTFSVHKPKFQSQGPIMPIEETSKVIRISSENNSESAGGAGSSKFYSKLDFSMINDDEEHSIQCKEYLENSSNAITTVPPTEEPEYSLSMGYEHLSTTPAMESDEVIKSSAKNLLPIPSEYEVTSDDESECDVLVKDEYSPLFTSFSNHIFDDNDDFTSSDDESLSDEENVPMEDFKVYSNPLFDDKEINSDPYYFNTESDLIESLSNHDILIDSSSKFDYLEEFSSALMPTSIIDKERIWREHEEYISLMEKLLAINSFPRPLENFHANTIDETLSTSPILVEYGDSQREEIDIFTSTDDLLPPSIESEDYNSEGGIHFLEELLSNDSILLLENESSNFDHHNDLSFPCPPPEPPDVEFFFELN
nr:hypothetical protein [Tanacetum cinerariifolium]